MKYFPLIFSGLVAFASLIMDAHGYHQSVEAADFWGGVALIIMAIYLAK